MKQYKIKKDEAGYLIIDTLDGNAVIMNHQNTMYPVLPKAIANMLVDDLNLFNRSLDDSLVYCAISTLIALRDVEFRFEANCDTAIQWDGAYRIDPNPEISVQQRASIAKLRALLGSNYVDLPLNYSPDKKDMLENDVEFVPETIEAYFNNLISEFNQAELFAIDLLNQLYNGRNYSMSALWVAGKITNEELVKSGLQMGYMKSNLHSTRYTKNELAEIKRDCERLNGLRVFLDTKWLL